MYELVEIQSRLLIAFENILLKRGTYVLRFCILHSTRELQMPGEPAPEEQTVRSARRLVRILARFGRDSLG